MQISFYLKKASNELLRFDKRKKIKIVEQVNKDIFVDIQNKQLVKTIVYFSDGDTYVRKAAYLTIGKIYNNNALFQDDILSMLVTLLKDEDCKIRQTAVNAAGEIGIKKFEPVESIFDKGLFDEHHSVRNAVIGSVKKMGNKNPAPILNWARKYLHHPDKEIRREICHGIELRGRTHPADILPLLKELQWDKTARVRNTLVHVLGQISYKKNCLLTVIDHLNNWDNKEVINKAIKEIIDVHQRYENFAAMTQQQAIGFINRHLKTPLPFSNNKP